MREEQIPLFDDKVFFDQRFTESYAGLIIKDPKIAVMELIANAWDAGATKVQISWPSPEKPSFKITDNGHGMTDDEFCTIWRTLAYNRIDQYGNYSDFPQDTTINYKRPVFGRNGKGRFAGFYFGNEYEVRSWRDGTEHHYLVSKGKDAPIKIEKKGEQRKEGHGFEIYIEQAHLSLNEETIRAEIGMRFISDPSFNVFLNGEEISFKDIPESNIKKIPATVDGLGELEIIVIDVQDTDRTTHQHGIAWHVNKRLVGECTWKGSGHENFLDGRRIAAKRYSFIVLADILKDVKSAILPDWSGFNPQNSHVQKVNRTVQEKIKQYLLSLTKGRREASFREIQEAHKSQIKQIKEISPKSYRRWENFVKTVLEDCPSIAQKDIAALAGILVKLELSESKYSLIEQLHKFSTGQLEDLDAVLKQWTFDLAKTVLDELKFRLRLLEELKNKLDRPKVYELHELQPLFHKGLWIFGPEYETIEYTSNEGMTKVIRKLLKIKKGKGSLNRPDFVVLPDGTAGFYSYPKYDQEGNEAGIEKLVVIELKKPGIKISEEHKNQCWKYIKELTSVGELDIKTKVTGFVLGSKIDPNEVSERTERDGQVTIKPLKYSHLITRAENRLLKLYNRVKGAPFLNQDQRKELDPESDNPQAQLSFKN